MRNDSPQNFNCEFSPETIDFIYGEMNDSRKNAFQIHLNKCAECADEIRDFSEIKFSIQDWKASEFDRMATPKIEIPYRKTNEVIIANEKVSLMDSFKSYFRFSPAISWTAGFAVLVFVFAATFFVLKDDEHQMIAENNTKANLSPTPKVITQSSPDVVSNPTPEKTENSNPPVDVDDKESEKQKIVRANTKPSSEQKTTSIKTIEKKSPVVENINNTKDQKAVQTKKKPRLNDLPEEDEDDGLRLADMFAELDTRE